MTKFSMFVPLLTAVSAVAMLLNSSLFSDNERKRATGVIVKSGRGELVLKQEAKTLTFSVTSETKCHLNDKVLTAGELENGRKATVVFSKRKGELIAKDVDVFPVYGELS